MPKRKAVVLTLLIALGLSACGGGHKTATTTTTTTTSTTSTTAPTTTAVAGPVKCSTTNSAFTLGNDIEVPNTGTDQHQVTLEFKNKSNAPCTIYGFPGVEVSGPSNGTTHTYDENHRKGTPTHLTLQPGKTATATLTYWKVTGVAEAGCPTGDGQWVPNQIKTTLPDDTNSFTAPWNGIPFDDCQTGTANPGDSITPLA